MGQVDQTIEIQNTSVAGIHRLSVCVCTQIETAALDSWSATIVGHDAPP